jgi:hypothetical protein
VRGLVADVNVEGHQERIKKLIERSGVGSVLAELGLRFATLSEIGLSADADDRAIWERCQEDGWVLFTDNRNDEGKNSLQATLASLWKPGRLPVLTLGDKNRFENSPEYRERVAMEVADLLFGIVDEEFCDTDRIFVPR